jgi:hypothetical protein
LHGIFFSFQFFLAGQQSKLTEKLSFQHIYGDERARRAGIFLEKVKISADSEIWMALAWNFLQFPEFFGWPTIKTNGKTQKLSS